MSFDIQAIKDAVTIPQLWDRLNTPGECRAKGMSLCPFHSEKSGSFSVFANGTRFHCFGCGAGSDVIDFYRLTLGLPDTREGRGQAMVGIARLLNMEGAGDYQPLPKHTEKKVQPIQKMDEYDAGEETIPRSYLEWASGKGITRETIELMVKEKALAFRNGNPCYKYNTGLKVRFDIASSKSSRWMEGSPQGGIWRFGQACKFSVKLISLSEGESDTMVAQQHLPDFARSIGIPQASYIPTPAIAGLIGSGRTVLLALDNDEAGRLATQRITELLHEFANDCNVLHFPWNKDDPKDLCALNPLIRANKFDKILTHFKMSV